MVPHQMKISQKGGGADDAAADCGGGGMAMKMPLLKTKIVQMPKVKARPLQLTPVLTMQNLSKQLMTQTARMTKHLPRKAVDVDAKPHR